jgi:FAD:protein FMN transferase
VPFSRVLVPPVLNDDLIVPDGTWECFEGKAFGTTWRVDVVRSGSTDEMWLAALEQHIHATLETIDAQMSLWRPDSDIVRFNASPPGTRVLLRAPMRDVISHALEIAHLTQGLFDPTLHEAVARWGFGARLVADDLPDPTALSVLARQRCDWRDVVISDATLTAQFGLAMDLCAIAKGYAVDAVMDVVRTTSGAEAALVEIGGELKGWGLRPDGMPWWVQLEAAGAPQGALTLAALCGWAVATTGDSQRSFSRDGQDYCHTIDPQTLSPVQTALASVTVFDPLCWRADALATAMTVMGREKALAFAEAQDIPCLITHCAKGRATESLSPALRQWLDEDD